MEADPLSAAQLGVAVVAAGQVLLRVAWQGGVCGVRRIDVGEGRDGKGTLRFGSRAVDVDVVIDHPSIAPSHAEIEADHESLWIHDLGSACGTFVEGIEVKSARILIGQTLRLGEVDLRIESAALEPSVDDAGLRIDLPAAMLDLSHREFCDRWSDIGERFFLQRKLAKHGRNVSRVSREIALARTYTHKLIKKYGL